MGSLLTTLSSRKRKGSHLFIAPRFNKGEKPFFFMSGEQDLMLESPGYALEFLPESVAVLASCNDLLLCWAKQKIEANFYVCNPSTMQWLLLPPVAIKNYYVKVEYGLVYEPNYQQLVRGNNEIRFRVMCISAQSRNSVSMHTYVSETRQWNEPLLLGLEYIAQSNIIPHDGKLFWHNMRDVIAYDPFKNETVFIDGSDPDFIVGNSYNRHRRVANICLGICEGVLQVMKLVSFINNVSVNYFAVWELKTDEANGSRRLNLKHKISSVLGESLVPRFLSVTAQVLAFHPEERDTVYIGSGNMILTFKIQSGRLEVVGDSSTTAPSSHGYLFSSIVFTTKQYRCPTPIPLLPQDSHH